MHDDRAIISAPFSMRVFTFDETFFPGQPPHVINPISSTSSPLNAPSLSFIAFIQLEAGQNSATIAHLTIPTFSIWRIEIKI